MLTLTVPREAAPGSRVRKRIAFVINSLGPGGAERVLVQILEMAPRNWDCHLILLDSEDEWRTAPDFVTVHRLDCRRGMIASVVQLRRTLAEIRPQVAVSFLVRANVATVIAARSMSIPCVISERSQLSTHLQNEYRGLKRIAAKTAPRLTYPRADRVIAVSNGVRSDLVRRFGVRPGQVQTIYNPYDIEKIRRSALETPEFDLPSRFMVSAGRLVKRKGFDDLLDAYAGTARRLPLCILGEGAERERLAARIDAMGLRDHVKFLGYARNPFAIVSHAEMFVSPSHCEGFPNAIAEAMVLGVPVVSTDCPSGPAELLDEVESVDFDGVHAGKYGVLVPVGQPTLLADAMRQMSVPSMCRHYSSMSRRRMDNFRIDTITAQFWTMFGELLAMRTSTAQSL